VNGQTGDDRLYSDYRYLHIHGRVLRPRKIRARSRFCGRSQVPPKSQTLASTSNLSMGASCAQPARKVAAALPFFQMVLRPSPVAI
jgi:hypothetical protein